MISGSPRAPRATAAGMLFMLALASAGIFVPGHAQAAAMIAWQVENPFRFFTDPSDTEAHRATYRALGPTERSSPVLYAERALQSRQAVRLGGNDVPQDVLDRQSLQMRRL